MFLLFYIENTIYIKIIASGYISGLQKTQTTYAKSF